MGTAALPRLGGMSLEEEYYLWLTKDFGPW